MKTELLPIKSIKGNPKNPRIIKDDKFQKLVKSLQEFPEMANVRPVVCNTDMVILGGNMRWKAAIEAGWKEIPVQIVDWSEDKQQEFIIKDNVSGGEWNWDDLANEWDLDLLNDWGLDLPDITMGEELTAEEDDYEVPDQVETDIVEGDLFEIGDHRLLCGDSTSVDAVEKLMDGHKADMVLTDPPYGYSYKSNRGANHKELLNDDEILDFLPIAKLFSVGFVMVFCAFKNLSEWIEYFKSCFELNNMLVWNKGGGGMGDLEKTFSTDYELCLVSHNGQKIRGERTGSVWSFGKDSEIKKDGSHPTPKPVALICEMLNKCSDTGNKILDLFLGSGTTMVACHQLNRKCYGMELDPKYCQVIIDRMKKLDPDIVIKKNGVEI